ncbi:hypothetical protein GQ43DRAFT_466258 [Delitschia confertaspora ATCC 74209]|uniref:DUF7730 domain-containing protein n=1 Tax=Delitschia confertaspora ATCC 74209 TaxID=1513339 RepID=A0A9P4JEF8_9PLEO|nr:hypothetical protein GQ43DRAFT_466258 [Delitschia confertaspora ATCC 74209]
MKAKPYTTHYNLFSCLPGIKWIPYDITEEPPTRAVVRAETHSKTLAMWITDLQPTVRRKESNTPPRRLSDPGFGARTEAQSQSPFFTKLPLELRFMVYEYVFGSETVHLTVKTYWGKRVRMQHHICNGYCLRTDNQRIITGSECGRERLDQGWKGLLGCCRRMYTESIPHFYTSHTFSLLHISHLILLSKCLPSPHLNYIRTLRLRWRIRGLPFYRRVNEHNTLAYPEDTAQWLKAWEILKRMEGLRNLHVVLSDPRGLWKEKWVDVQGEMLEETRDVCLRGRFELVLPYTEDVIREGGSLRAPVD